MIEKFQVWLNEFSFTILFSLIAGTARFMYSDKKSILSFCRGILISCFAGALAALALKEYHLSEGMKGALVGVAAFVADELLVVIIVIAKNFKKDPVGSVKDYLKAKK